MARQPVHRGHAAEVVSQRNRGDPRPCEQPHGRGSRQRRRRRQRDRDEARPDGEAADPGHRTGMQRPWPRTIEGQSRRGAGKHQQRDARAGSSHQRHEPRGAGDQRQRRSANAPGSGARAGATRCAAVPGGANRPKSGGVGVTARQRCRFANLSISIITLKAALRASPRPPEARGARVLSRFSNTGKPPPAAFGLYLASRSPSLAQWPQLLDIREKVFRRQALKPQPVSLPILSVRGETS